MPFYYYEIPDPAHPGQLKRAYFSDDEHNQDDTIYKMPGGIARYEKYKQILDAFGQQLRDAFLDNKSIKGKGHTLKPELEDTPYQDPELARLHRKGKPVTARLTPDDPREYEKQVHIKVTGTYQPEPCKFERMIDYALLPTLPNMEQESLDTYTRAEAALPTLTDIKRGMKVKITGEHLRIRPNSTKNHGLFLKNAEGKTLELTDFLLVNSNPVLLLSIPKDLPVGTYTLCIVSGWYADPAINRVGESEAFELV